MKTQAFQNWEAYAMRAGLLDENGNARDASAAQTSWNAWEQAAKSAADEIATWLEGQGQPGYAHEIRYREWT